MYACGWFSGTANFGTGQPVQAIGQLDSYVLKMTTSGGTVDMAQAGATGGIVQVMDMVEDAGTIYVTGQLIGSANFGTNQATSSNGGQDRTVSSLHWVLTTYGPGQQWHLALIKWVQQFQ